MTNQIRFHLDENVDPVIAVALRRYGADVTTTIEAGLLGSDDETQLAYVEYLSSAIITKYLGQRASRPLTHTILFPKPLYP